MDDFDRLITVGFAFIVVLSVVQFVGAFDPRVGLWVGVVGTSATMVWEAMQT